MLLVIILERNPMAAAPLGFAHTIDQHSDGYMLVSRNIWLVSSFNHGTQFWTDQLGVFVGPNDRLLIFEATNAYGGLAPQAIWTWCDEAIAAGGVTQSNNPFDY